MFTLFGQVFVMPFIQRFYQVNLINTVCLFVIVHSNTVNQPYVLGSELKHKENEIDVKDISVILSISHQRKNTDNSSSGSMNSQHILNESLFIINQDRKLQISKKRQTMMRNRRAATAIKERLWDDGVIPFEIRPIYTRKQMDMIKLSMEKWEDPTCIIFKEKIPSDKNYLVFTNGSCGCCSHVGKNGVGGQDFSIGKNCGTMGIVMHELGHALGFWHEHSRPDRDQYVDVILDNVLDEKKSEFVAKDNTEVDSLGEPYDVDSIMHYGSHAAAKDSNKSTIKVIQKPGEKKIPQIGQRHKLSAGDIRQANKLYNCPQCGATLFLPQGTFNYTAQTGLSKPCQWRIRAPYGEKIYLSITSIKITDSDECKTNYLEVRDGHYFKSPLIGRYCGSEVPQLLKSSGRRLWVEFNTEEREDKFTADYVKICGGNIEKDEDVIASPDYPNLYAPNSHCVWNITVPAGSVIVVSIEFFELELEDKCESADDFLEFRDGHGENAKLLGRYCGNNDPKEIIRSTGNKMSLIFKSDSEINKTGFLVTFRKQ